MVDDEAFYRFSVIDFILFVIICYMYYLNYLRFVFPKNIKTHFSRPLPKTFYFDLIIENLTKGSYSLKRITPESVNKDIEVEVRDESTGLTYTTTFAYPNWITKDCSCDTSRVLDHITSRNCKK